MVVYDQLGRLDDLVHYGPEGFEGDPGTLADNPVLARFDYTLRADGKRTAERVYQWDGQPGGQVLVGEYGWTYDAAGRLVQEVFDEGGEWSQKNRWSRGGSRPPVVGFNSSCFAANGLFG